MFPKSNNKFKLALAQIVRHQSDHGGQSVMVWQFVERTGLGAVWPRIHKDTTLLADISNHVQMKSVTSHNSCICKGQLQVLHILSNTWHLACLTVRKFRLFILNHWYYRTSIYIMPHCSDLFFWILIVHDPFVIRGIILPLVQEFLNQLTY